MQSQSLKVLWCPTKLWAEGVAAAAGAAASNALDGACRPVVLQPPRVSAAVVRLTLLIKCASAPVPQIARDKLVSLGTPIGKLTHSGKFRLTVGALDVLSRYAKHKVGGCSWLACV